MFLTISTLPPSLAVVGGSPCAYQTKFDARGERGELARSWPFPGFKLSEEATYSYMIKAGGFFAFKRV